MQRGDTNRNATQRKLSRKTSKSKVNGQPMNTRKTKLVSPSALVAPAITVRDDLCILSWAGEGETHTHTQRERRRERKRNPTANEGA